MHTDRRPLRRPLPRLLCCLGLLGLPGLALAEPDFDIGKVWFNAGLYSYHYNHDKGLENKNFGIGVEWPINETYSLTAGAFRNSDRERSHYLGLYVMPFEFHGVKLGAVVGGFDGYPHYRNGNWFPAVLPAAAIEGKHWGLNLLFIPEIKNRLYGALAFQLKYRFGD